MARLLGGRLELEHVEDERALRIDAQGLDRRRVGRQQRRDARPIEGGRAVVVVLQMSNAAVVDGADARTMPGTATERRQA